MSSSQPIALPSSSTTQHNHQRNHSFTNSLNNAGNFQAGHSQGMDYGSYYPARGGDTIMTSGSYTGSTNGDDFNPASYTKHYMGSPLSWRPGSFGGRHVSTGPFYAASPTAHLLNSIDPNELRSGKISSMECDDRNSLLNAVNIFAESEREGDLCRDYTCCGQRLPDLHALLDHFEQVHIVVVDANGIPLPTNQNGNHLQSSNDGGTMRVTVSVPFNPQCNNPPISTNENANPNNLDPSSSTIVITNTTSSSDISSSSSPPNFDANSSSTPQVHDDNNRNNINHSNISASTTSIQHIPIEIGSRAHPLDHHHHHHRQAQLEGSSHSHSTPYGLDYFDGPSLVHPHPHRQSTSKPQSQQQHSNSNSNNSNSNMISNLNGGHYGVGGFGDMAYREGVPIDPDDMEMEMDLEGYGGGGSLSPPTMNDQPMHLGTSQSHQHDQQQQQQQYQTQYFVGGSVGGAGAGTTNQNQNPNQSPSPPSSNSPSSLSGHTMPSPSSGVPTPPDTPITTPSSAYPSPRLGTFPTSTPATNGTNGNTLTPGKRALQHHGSHQGLALGGQRSLHRKISLQHIHQERLQHSQSSSSSQRGVGGGGVLGLGLGLSEAAKGVYASAPPSPHPGHVRNSWTHLHAMRGGGNGGGGGASPGHSTSISSTSSNGNSNSLNGALGDDTSTSATTASSSTATTIPPPSSSTTTTFPSNIDADPLIPFGSPSNGGGAFELGDLNLNMGFGMGMVMGSPSLSSSGGGGEIGSMSTPGSPDVTGSFGGGGGGVGGHVLTRHASMGALGFSSAGINNTNIDTNADNNSSSNHPDHINGNDQDTNVWGGAGSGVDGLSLRGLGGLSGLHLDSAFGGAHNIHSEPTSPYIQQHHPHPLNHLNHLNNHNHHHHNNNGNHHLSSNHGLHHHHQLNHHLNHLNGHSNAFISGGGFGVGVGGGLHRMHRMSSIDGALLGGGLAGLNSLHAHRGLGGGGVGVGAVDMQQPACVPPALLFSPSGTANPTPVGSRSGSPIGVKTKGKGKKAGSPSSKSEGGTDGSSTSEKSSSSSQLQQQRQQQHLASQNGVSAQGTSNGNPSIRPASTTGVNGDASSSTTTTIPTTQITLSRPPTSMLLSKPFRCPKPNCNKSYKQANGLKYHMTHGSCNFAPPKDIELRDRLLEARRREGAESNPGSTPGSGASTPIPGGAVVPDPLGLGTISELELREVEKEAERRLRPFACGIGDCPRRYKNMNGLRYHYQHSGDHGAVGLTLLASGQHRCLARNSDKAEKEREREGRRGMVSAPSSRSASRASSMNRGGLGLGGGVGVGVAGPSNVGGMNGGGYGQVFSANGTYAPGASANGGGGGGGGVGVGTPMSSPLSQGGFSGQQEYAIQQVQAQAVQMPMSVITSVQQQQQQSQQSQQQQQQEYSLQMHAQAQAQAHAQLAYQAQFAELQHAHYQQGASQQQQQQQDQGDYGGVDVAMS